MQEEKQVEFIPLRQIIAGNNDRKRFSAEELQELADSVAEHGLQQPITLRKIGNMYRIVMGERRYRSHCLYTKQVENGERQSSDKVRVGYIEAFVREMTDKEERKLMLIENVNRVDLSPLEESDAYQERVTEGDSVTEIARYTGKKKSHIEKLLALQSLVAPARQMLESGQLAETFAYLMVDLNEVRQHQCLGLLAKKQDISLVYFKTFVDDLKQAQAAEGQAVMDFWVETLDASTGGNVRRLTEGPDVVIPFPLNESIPQMRWDVRRAGRASDAVYRYIQYLRDNGFESEAGAVANVYACMVKQAWWELPQPSYHKAGIAPVEGDYHWPEEARRRQSEEVEVMSLF